MIPTAEEFKQKLDEANHAYDDVYLMIEFAKLHVEAALKEQLAEKDKHYYRCNKCGQSVSDLKGVSCHQPMEVRTSGMCGGSCTVEMTVTEYYDQIIEWKDKKLADVLEKIRTVRPKKKNGEFHEGMEHAVDRILELLNQKQDE